MLKRNGELNNFFHLYFFNNDISLIISGIVLTFSLCVPKVLLKGTVSQIIHVGHTFYFITKNV